MFLVRHGEKVYGNRDRMPKVDCNTGAPILKLYQHDSPLTQSAVEDILEVREECLEQFAPEYIVCSPFLRCRQTAQILSGGQIPIYIDASLREFLGNADENKIEIDPITQQHTATSNLKLKETEDEFIQRCKQIPKLDFWKPGVWIVTHGFVIKTLLDLTNKKRNKSPEMGDATYLNKEKIAAARNHK